MILSPDKVANVCQGDELVLTCNVTGNFLEWRSTYLIPSGYIVQSFGLIPIETRQVNSVTVTISRSSGPNVLPVSSTLSLNRVTDDLNGTEITCTDLASSNATSTIINVINSDSIQG